MSTTNTKVQDLDVDRAKEDIQIQIELDEAFNNDAQSKKSSTSSVDTTFEKLYALDPQTPKGKVAMGIQEELDNLNASMENMNIFSPQREAAFKRGIELRNKLKQIDTDTFDAIKGSNVSEVLGQKVITEDNPLGIDSRKFIPSPDMTPTGITLVKSATDVARGILNLPEAIVGTIGLRKAEEFFQDVNLPGAVPKVSSDSTAVNVMSELIGLTLGGMGAVSLAGKIKTLNEIAETMPVAKAFFSTAGKKLNSVIGQQAGAARRAFDRALPTGTVPTGLGAAAVASEDVSTFFDLGPKATIGEVKLAILKETLVAGVIFNAVAGLSNITKVTPGATYAFEQLSAAVTSIFAAKNINKADEIVVELFATTLLEGGNKLAKAQTPEQVNEVYTELYAELLETYRKTSGGGDLQAILNNVDTAVEGAPTISEILGDQAMMRLETAFANVAGGSTSSKVLRDLLQKIDSTRQRFITGSVKEARDTLSPSGLRAEGELAEQLPPVLEADTAKISVIAQNRSDRIARQTQDALDAAEAAADKNISNITEDIVSSQQAAAEAADKVLTVIDNSPVSRNNLTDINNLIDEDGAMNVINEVLSANLAEKNALGVFKDNALRAIEISGEQAQRIVDDLITVYTNPNFIIGPEVVQEASKDLSKLIRTFKSAADTNNPIDQKLKGLVLELQDVNLSANRLMELAREIGELTKQGAKLPSDTAASTVLKEGAEEIIELPNITAFDLESIIKSTARRSAELKKKALAQGDSTAFQTAEELTNYTGKLNSVLDALLVKNPDAKKAKQAFDDYFKNFKEKWRSATGKTFESNIVTSTTRADIADVEVKIMKLMTTANSTKGQRQVIIELLNEMPEEVQQQFTQSIGTRLVADFASVKGFEPSAVAEITIKQASQILQRLSTYLNKNSQFETALPGAFNRLRSIRTELEEVVSPAIAAQGTAKSTADAGAKSIQQQQKQLAKQTQKLNAQQKKQLADIENQLAEAIRQVNNSSLAKMLEADNPTQYIQSLFTKIDGFKKYKDIWEQAGRRGVVKPSGITSVQEALQEATSLALMRKVYTETQESLGATPDKLKDIILAMQGESNTLGKIFKLSLEKNKDGFKVLSEVESMVSSYAAKRSIGSLGARGSATFEKQQLASLVNNISMVVYGPLTKNFRIASAINKVFFSTLFNSDFSVAQAFARVISDPKYSKAVLDKAAEIRKLQLVPDKEEAFRKAFGVTLLAAAGIKKYYEITDEDPMTQLRKDIEQTAIIQDTPEALGVPTVR